MDSLTELFDKLSMYLTEDFVPQTEEIPANISYILKQSFESVKSSKRDNNLRLNLESTLDIVWEDLNTGHWSNVSILHRKLYSLFSFLKVMVIIKENLDVQYDVDILKEAVQAADIGLLLGSEYHNELSHAATLLNNVISKGKTHGETYICSAAEYDLEDFTRISKEPIKTVRCPSIEHFNKHYFTPELPVKLTDCITHWPALKKWSNLNYIKNTAGSRTVPVELGTSYTHEEWGMKLLTVEQFIEKHILCIRGKIGYLAQHQLFDQIPELKRDICIPEYCCLSKDECSTSDPDINAWFGPAGTVTPLHYDPKHNLLTQVVGRKKVLLYSPEDTANLYPHDSEMLHNTARVDPQNPDFENFPHYKLAKGYECILNPGELLYIPPKWWHYVKSIDVSFSVSFWWR